MGWIILDKPLGMSSTQASTRIRRLLGYPKAGHAGTLDPLATGILPIALGEATKTIPYCVCDEKSYEFRVQWGIQTSTDDAEGDPIAHSPHRPSADEIQRALSAFQGLIQQRPPVYSAIKIDGQRAYSLARSGVSVDMAERSVTIHSFVLKDFGENEALFDVACGPGTYIRSLARDLALQLGTVAHVTHLRRTRVGPFSLDQAVSLEQLQAETSPEERRAIFLRPLGIVLQTLPHLPLSPEETRRIRLGQSLPLDLFRQHLPEPLASEVMVVLRHDDQVVALARLTEHGLHPSRVFC